MYIGMYLMIRSVVKRGTSDGRPITNWLILDRADVRFMR